MSATRREMFRIIGGSVAAAPAIATGSPVPKVADPIEIPRTISGSEHFGILPGQINDMVRAIAELEKRTRGEDE